MPRQQDENWNSQVEDVLISHILRFVPRKNFKKENLELE